MSLGQNSFAAELESELRGASLPTDPHRIVGRLYWFGCEYGSHHHVLVGTVQAVEISDEGGLNLYVSNPRFGGRRLISITYADYAWMAYVDVKLPVYTDAQLEQMSEKEFERKTEEDLASRFFKGEFHLF